MLAWLRPPCHGFVEPSSSSSAGSRNAPRRAPEASSSHATNGSVRYRKSYFLSTEQMLRHAENSPAKESIVGTETGMLYRLRKLLPEKAFHPVSPEAVCEYMKMNTLEKLLDSLEHDRIEVQVEPEVRQKAQAAIDRMLTIQ